ncbi:MULTISPECIES: ferredoxin [unclassified Nocardioides]|jgi:ferredoxin|uniref:ferredoxin n=1 Tax=unclassified Nocardioides TaxID=2615069 RepID=UPI0007038CB3|nr:MULTISPECIES: ferredoxin [unclassified Nocardioides]KRC59754.1 ferredoxin [Nocardioides sp. Root79]KRC68419.1 ferredoxin [Nocardioides sp. Root240]
MKITVDTNLCEVHGDCVVVAPDFFDIGEDDEVVQVLDAEPGEEHRATVVQAAKMCPVAAIRIEG